MNEIRRHTRTEQLLRNHRIGEPVITTNWILYKERIGPMIKGLGVRPEWFWNIRSRRNAERQFRK